MKHLKMLCVAMVAVAGVMALTGTASAQAKLFHAETAPATVKGEQEESSSFTTNAGTITCTNGTFTGESSVVTTETLDINFSYSGCTFLGVAGVAVEPRGCHYRFNANGPVGVVGTSCDAEPIRFSALTCTVTIGARENESLNAVSYTNLGTGTTRTVTVTPAVTGITYTTSAGCVNGAETAHNGKYEKGATLVKGFNSKGVQQGIWVE
jgi:hypothetical protein